MANSSSIWLSWNPITWCIKYSDGCKNCYAKGMAEKFQKIWVKKYKNWFQITFHKDALNFPKKTKRSSIIFPNSMTDLFQEWVPFERLKEIFDIMNENNHHLYFVLTKRTERMLELSKKLEIWNHIWMWTTIESEKYIHRINYLKQIKCKHKFIVTEPLLSNISNLDLTWIDWLTWWSESGPFAREIKTEWVENLALLCKKYNVPFSFKYRKKRTPNLVAGKFNYYAVPKIIKEFEEKSKEYVTNRKKQDNTKQLQMKF
jgi:protein gp37